MNLETRNPESEHPSEPRDALYERRARYWETVAIGWRIFWQGIGSFILLLFVANLLLLGFLPELTRTGPSYWALAFPMIFASTLSLFVLLPLVARGLTRKPFGSFRLALIRDEPFPVHQTTKESP